MEFAITVWDRVMDGYFFPIGPTGTDIGSKSDDLGYDRMMGWDGWYPSGTSSDIMRL